MKKIAVCMYGGIADIKNKLPNSIIKQRVLPDEYTQSLNSIYRNFCSGKGKVDFFLHCWNPEHEKKICKILNPIDKKFERMQKYRLPNKFEIIKNIVFRELQFKPIKFIKSLIKIKNLLKYELNDGKNYGIFSRWNSTKKVVGLKKDYELREGFKYDGVVLCRYDLFFSKKIDFNSFDFNFFHIEKCFNYEDENGNNVPSCDYWHYKNNNLFINKVKDKFDPEIYGLDDMLTFSKSENIDNFSELYDKLDFYIHKQLVRINPHHLFFHHLKKIKLNNHIKRSISRPDDFDLARRIFKGARY